MPAKLNLTIISVIPIYILPNNEVSIDRKFFEGIVEYLKYWSGSITILMQKQIKTQKNALEVTLRLEELPFNIQIIDSIEEINLNAFKNKASVVLASLDDYRQNHISQSCCAAGVPCIYISEYSLQTRKQIVSVTTNNPIQRFRKILWEEKQERKRHHAVALANGIQCNGTPTYNAYRTINPNPILFFDTRMTESMLASEADIENRTFQQNDSTEKPIRLLFSGRLIKMKGADHLLFIAVELMQAGIPFQLFICGDGDLKISMEKQIISKGLSHCVKMMGLLDFQLELVPLLKEKIDVFICCHRQGDPSCTYLETMSCGVPIIGYANEAFEGIVQYSQAGWLVEMNQPALIAQKIVDLYRSRQEIKDMSLKSLKFAKHHTFEQEFENRVSHIQQIAEGLPI